MHQKCTKSAFLIFVNLSVPFLYAAAAYIRVVFQLTIKKKTKYYHVTSLLVLNQVSSFPFPISCVN